MGLTDKEKAIECIQNAFQSLQFFLHNDRPLSLALEGLVFLHFPLLGQEVYHLKIRVSLWLKQELMGVSKQVFGREIL